MTLMGLDIVLTGFDMNSIGFDMILNVVKNVRISMTTNVRINMNTNARPMTPNVLPNISNVPLFPDLMIFRNFYDLRFFLNSAKFSKFSLFQDFANFMNVAVL